MLIQIVRLIVYSKLFASLMMNYFPKRPSGSPLHTLSKLYMMSPNFEAVYCFFRSPKGGSFSIFDDLSCFLTLSLKFYS